VTRWHRDPRVLSRRSGPTVILACPGREDLLVLEGSAALVWDLLSESVEDEQLVATIAEGFGLDPEAVASDVRPFLTELHGVGAVQRL
jgi:hypothetical protein